MTRFQRMYNKAFEEAFLRFINEGVSEDEAINLAEAEAQEGADRYCDDKRDERKCE